MKKTMKNDDQEEKIEVVISEKDSELIERLKEIISQTSQTFSI